MVIVDRVLQKPELRGVNKELAASFVDQWFLENTKAKKRYDEKPEGFLRSKEYKKLQADVREKLRRVYGVFFMPDYVKKREAAVQAAINNPCVETVHAVLALHRSTHERLEYYDFIVTQLLDVVGDVSRVLDLGCGFNPFGIVYLDKKPTYHCVDIACEDLRAIDVFLSAVGVEHSVHCVDLTNLDAVSALPQADVAFAFKLFDSLEEKHKGIVKKLLDVIPAKKLVVSFPTASIGQKKHIRPREWFTKLVTGRVLEVVTLPNEQFLIITK